MDYLVSHALEIMYLCLGFGFLVLVIVVSRFLITLNRTVKKVNYFADIFGDYVKKPIEVLMQINEYIAPALEMFLKKK